MTLSKVKSFLEKNNIEGAKEVLAKGSQEDKQATLYAICDRLLTGFDYPGSSGEMVRFLIELGANVNKIGSAHFPITANQAKGADIHISLLTYAKRHSLDEVARILAEHGAVELDIKPPEDPPPPAPEEAPAPGPAQPAAKATGLHEGLYVLEGTDIIMKLAGSQATMYKKAEAVCFGVYRISSNKLTIAFRSGHKAGSYLIGKTHSYDITDKASFTNSHENWVFKAEVKK